MSIFYHYFLNKNRIKIYLIRYGWLLWTVFSSHHVRDANRRGLWFYPFGSTPPISNFNYILITIILPYLTLFFMNMNIYNNYYFKPMSNNFSDVSYDELYSDIYTV